MTSKDGTAPIRGPNGPEDDLNSKPNSNINVQKTPVSLLQVIEIDNLVPNWAQFFQSIVCGALNVLMLTYNFSGALRPTRDYS